MTFLERQRFHSIGNLSPDAAARALEQPIVDAGRTIEPGALDLLTVYTNGYPYAIQEVGHHTWEAAGSQRRVTLAHAETGIAAAAVTFGEIFAKRWSRLSPGQRAYMRAFAEVADADGVATTAAIVECMGAVRTTVAKYRDELIKRHQVLYAVGHGRVGSALPGFIAWVRSRDTSMDQRRGTHPPDLA